MSTRIVEPDLTEGPTLHSMMDEIFVICPRCEARARIAPLVSDEDTKSNARRLVCENCGLAKNWSGEPLSYAEADSPAIDPYFHLPLWLSVSCCGKTLWFFNARHMQLVEQYVRAELREKQKHPEHGWFNGSLFNRLPKFIKEAKHRDEILKAIAVLRHRE